MHRRTSRASKLARSTNLAWTLLGAAFLGGCGGNPPAANVATDANTTDGRATSISDGAFDSGASDAASDGDAASVCVVDAAIDSGPLVCLIAAAPPPAPLDGGVLDGGVLDGGVLDGDAGDDGGSDATASVDATDLEAGGAGATDAASDAGAPDFGAPSATYPAFAIDAPQVVSLGGKVLSAPRVVTVTWNGEADQGDLETFVDALGQTPYWNSTSCEYGVGPMTGGCANHARVSAPFAATAYEGTVDKFVVKNASDPKTSGWPAPTDQTIYLVVLPQATSLQMSTGGGTGDACSLGVGGYHTSAQLTDGSHVQYAVIPRCPLLGDIFTTATWAISHELIEAVTDPRPGAVGSDSGGLPTYRGFDDAHYAWNLFQVGQTEIGDACELYYDSAYDDPTTGQRLQRTWSNGSMYAGHHPCVPAPDPSTTPYFNVAPLDLPIVPYATPSFIDGSTVLTRAVVIPVGGTGSFRVGYYSDGPIPGGWNLKAVEGNALPGTSLTASGKAAFDNGNLDLHVDNTTGENGNTATVTVHVRDTDPLLGANLVTLVSTLGGRNHHYWPVLIVSP